MQTYNETLSTVLTVNTLIDENNGYGVGRNSLREAIARANRTPGTQTIRFAVNGTIALNRELPDIRSSNFGVPGSFGSTGFPDGNAVGIDLANGGTGNDTYQIDNSRDRIIETSTNPQEIDGVTAFTNYILSANVENLSLDGFAFNGTGNNLNNNLTGNNRNNRIVGLTGNDTLEGNLGDDILLGGNGNDLINSNSGVKQINGGNGSDTVSYNYVEFGTNLSINLVTNRAGVPGSTGFDTIISIENVIGGGGNEIIIGNDTLIGGVGRDSFTYTTRNQGRDRITDFAPLFDTITVSAVGFGGGLRRGILPPTRFHVGVRAADRSDRFIYNRANGVLSFDADGTGRFAQIAIATLNAQLPLTHADILVS
jgi:Ca2+-binding RTX toxin-like protein